MLEADSSVVHYKTSSKWFCDACQGQWKGASPAGTMYRCLSGCDYDACVACLDPLPTDISDAASKLNLAQTTAAATMMMHTRLSDVPGDDGMLSPIRGVLNASLLPLMDAALATGLTAIDAEAFMAGEQGRQLAATDIHGLSADEAGAFTLYTMESQLYPTLNRLLRERDRAALLPYFSYLRLMLHARDKLPAYVGTVWRGVKGVDLRANFPEGMEFYWWPFSSTTKKLSTLQREQFLGTSGVRTVFNIQVRTGVDIVRYSTYQADASEAEVLLYPGTKLKVVDSMDMGASLFMVHLQEMDVPVQLMQ